MNNYIKIPICTGVYFFILKKDTTLKDLRITGRIREWMARHPGWSRNSYAVSVKIENADAAIIEGFNRVLLAPKARVRYRIKLNYSLIEKKENDTLVTQSLRSRYRKLIGDHRRKTRSISSVHVHSNTPHIGSNTALQKSTIRLRARIPYVFVFFNRKCSDPIRYSTFDWMTLTRRNLVLFSNTLLHMVSLFRI